jgi:dihydropteroate synthase
MIDEGADIIDIGGESTRPKGTAYGGGAERVSDADEAARVLPVIEKLAAMTDVPISIDTTKASVARRALDAGAVIVNDISGFTFDPEMPATVGSRNASAIAMHIRGTPLTMQQNPVYGDLFGEVRAYLLAAIEKGRAAGIRQMIVDPGIGFGKTVDHNLRLLKGLGNFKDLGCPILVGPSRKSFIGAVLDLPVGERLEGTLAACAVAILGGANLLRVHDVKEARRVAVMVDAIRLAEV